MVAIDDIKDADSFRAWLEETNQPREFCVALAHRAAMRVLPLVWSYTVRDGHVSALPFLRALLVSGVAGRVPAALLTRDGHAESVQTAARAAAGAAWDAAGAAGAAWAAAGAAGAAWAAAWAAAGAAGDAAGAAGDAARAAAGAAWDAAGDAWTALRSDCEALGSGQPLAGIPSFNGAPPDWFEAPASLNLAAEWAFWLKWYANALEGRPQNWPVLLEIAIQPDEFWQGSDEEINARIAEIVAKYERLGAQPSLSDEALEEARQKSEFGETIGQDEEDNYFIQPIAEIPDDAFGLAKRRASDTIDDIRIAMRTSNALYRLGGVADDVERDLDRSADAPVLIFERLREAASDIEFYAEADDQLASDPIARRTALRFAARFQESAVELRLYDEVVRSALEAKAEFKPNIIPEAEREDVFVLAAKIAELSMGRLAEDMLSDPAMAADANVSPEKRRSLMYRLGSRVVRIVIFDRQAANDIAVATSIISFAENHGLVTALARIVNWFLK